MKKKAIVKNGFSMVELLVSLAIMAITVIAFIPVFNGSLSSILNSGTKSNAINAAQKNIEDALRSGTNLSTYTMNLTFKAQGLPNVDISVPGIAVNTSYQYSNITGNLKVFVPKNQ